MMSPAQWANMFNFFMKNPNGKITKEHIDQGVDVSSLTDNDKSSHVCVINGVNDTAYRVKNSWGAEFANGGFFLIKKDALGDDLRFMCIYHTYDDLTDQDKKAWENAPDERKQEWLLDHYNVYDHKDKGPLQ